MIMEELNPNFVLNEIRSDKRKLNEFRKIEIEINPIPKAEGSARVKIGNTEVLAGVKLEVKVPFPDKPDEGVLMTGAEFSPIASPDFETGPPKENAIELARVIDRGIRESGAIDTKKLCIKEKEKVWFVCLDVHILNHDGNLIDASSLAAITALMNTKIPEYDGEKINYEKKTKNLPMKSKPIAITVLKKGNKLFVDPTAEEEELIEARLTISTKDDGNICALQKGGNKGFSLDEINKAIDLSIKKGEELRKLIK